MAEQSALHTEVVPPSLRQSASSIGLTAFGLPWPFIYNAGMEDDWSVAEDPEDSDI